MNNWKIFLVPRKNPKEADRVTEVSNTNAIFPRLVPPTFFFVLNKSNVVFSLSQQI